MGSPLFLTCMVSQGWAAGFGLHAIEWYAGGLLLALSFVAILHRHWATRLQPSVAYWLPTAMVLAAAAFIAIALHIAPDSELSRGDVIINQTVQAYHPAWILAVFRWLTHFGDTWLLTCLAITIALGFWRKGHFGLGFSYAAAISANSLLNRGLKSVFERLRPIHENGALAIDGWSFPSGHTSGSVVAYGMLAYVLMRLLPARWHTAILLMATGIIYTTGWSRIFLNHHYPSDVLAGFLSGSLCLTVGILITEMYIPKPSQNRL